MYKFMNLGGINWEWLLCFRMVDEKSVEVMFHERWHRDDTCRQSWVDQCFKVADENPGYYSSCAMRETDDRVLEAISLDGGRTWLDVVNKQYVFSYENFEPVMRAMEEVS
jgi:hypothetical protein